jgi:septum formation protein
MSEEQILWYIESGEPMDKAGAYGIQGLGGRFVLEYDGDYDTVVGLCLPLTEKLISKALSEEKND